MTGSSVGAGSGLGTGLLPPGPLRGPKRPRLGCPIALKTNSLYSYCEVPYMYSRLVACSTIDLKDCSNKFII